MGRGFVARRAGVLTLFASSRHTWQSNLDAKFPSKIFRDVFCSWQGWTTTVQATNHKPERQHTMLRYNLTGKATITTPSGTFADATKAVEVTGETTPDVSVSGVIRSTMSLLSAAVHMLIDPILRKIIVTDDAGANIDAAALWSSSFNPLDGQTGRTLEWEAQAAVGAFPNDLSAALAGVLAPVTPKRSVESMVSALLDAVPEAYKDRVQIAVNQADSNIIVNYYATAGARAVDTGLKAGALEAGTNSAVVELSGAAIQTEAPSGDTSLPFEGGLISRH